MLTTADYLPGVDNTAGDFFSRKAVSNGSHFDVWSSTFIIIGYAIPGVFSFAILLIVIFAGGSYFDPFFRCAAWSPLILIACRGIRKIADYLWHITLPVLATVIGGSAALTMLTKNSFLDEIRKQYVVTARAKGVGEKQILWKHVFRNAMPPAIAEFSRHLYQHVLYRFAAD